MTRSLLNLFFLFCFSSIEQCLKHWEWYFVVEKTKEIYYYIQTTESALFFVSILLGNRWCDLEYNQEFSHRFFPSRWVIIGFTVHCGYIIIFATFLYLIYLFSIFVSFTKYIFSLFSWTTYIVVVISHRIHTRDIWTSEQKIIDDLFLLWNDWWYMTTKYCLLNNYSFNI